VSPWVKQVILWLVAIVAPLLAKLFGWNIPTHVLTAWVSVFVAMAFIIYRQAAGDKDWWLSKTNWSAIIAAAIVAIQQAFNIQVDPAYIPLILGAVWVIVGIVAKLLRKPIDSTKLGTT
jgi:hypothetical protein